MISREPLPLYEAYNFLLNLSSGFSLAEHCEELITKRLQSAEEYKYCFKILSDLENRLLTAVTVEKNVLSRLFYHAVVRGSSHHTISAIFFLNTLRHLLLRIEWHFLNPCTSIA